MELISLGISKPFLIDALQYFHFTNATLVQELSIPKALSSHNLIVQAKNGTGKTLSFCLVALEMLAPEDKSLQCLILTATREIALQIFDFINELTYSSAIPVYTLLCCGGYSRNQTIKSLKQSVHIIVGTVGRVKDMIDSAYLKLDSLKLLVLDEADKISQPSLPIITKCTEANKLAFSATFSELSLKALEDACSPCEVLKCHGEDTSLQNIQEYMLRSEVSFKAKVTNVLKLLNSISFHQAIVFYNNKSMGEDLANRIRSGGFPCLYISGNLPQEQRLETIRNLRYFSIRVMLSTDLSARGIDVLNVNLVINFDVATRSDVYTHRIGRCGRFGTPGIAVSLCSTPEEEEMLLSYSSKIEDAKQLEFNFQPLPLTQEEEVLFEKTKEDPLEWVEIEDDCQLCKLNRFGQHCHCQRCVENYKFMVQNNYLS